MKVLEAAAAAAAAAPPSPSPPSSVQFGFPESMARDGTANKFELQARRRRRRDGGAEAVQSTQSRWIGRRESEVGIEMQHQQRLIVRGGILSVSRSRLSNGPSRGDFFKLVNRQLDLEPSTDSLDRKKCYKNFRNT